MSVLDFVEIYWLSFACLLCVFLFLCFSYVVVVLGKLEVLHGERRSRPEYDPVLPERPDGHVGDLAQPVGGGAAVRLHSLGQGGSCYLVRVILRAVLSRNRLLCKR